ncbi:elongation factor P [Altererythrobacter aquaemixtae]|uniref:Elongation factor P n=2 Tax=Pontixanthobacter aquaemixtae TaxID=1958940 RepID=A0A844ZSX3_9SPHN|nr:elongation factor P [Pontixanthobacter aquaemixtae]
MVTAPVSGQAQDRQGRLGTLPHGTYVCSTPGDAAGPAWHEIPDKDFIIANASTYETKDGSGTYLLTGENVVFTRGPMNGMRFQRTGTGTLRWIDSEGKPGRIRCVRRNGSA